MALNEQTLRERIRKEAGSPKIDEVDDQSISEAVQDCLDIMGQYIPPWKIYSLDSVKDQQEYSVSADVVDVLFCDWSGDVKFSDIFDSDFRILEYQFYDVETDIYNRVRDAMIKRQIMESYEWQFRESDRKLVLSPPPNIDGAKIWYIGKHAWALAIMPARFERYVTWYGTAQALYQVARKRRRLSAVAHTGTPIVWSEADPTLADAKALEEKFYEAMEAEARRALF